jgi:hypothetical protein
MVLVRPDEPLRSFVRHVADLPGRLARTARQIAFMAIFLDALAIAMFFLTGVLGFVTFAFGIGFAVLAVVVSIVGMVVSMRCLHPRPQGAFFALILSVAIIAGYVYVAHQLAGLGHMH